MNKRKDKVTITDVANKAGVSLATVSRVLNNKSLVKEKTYQKVLYAIHETGYPFEPETKDSSSNLVFILLPSIENPFYSKIILGIQSAVERHGFQYLMHQSGNTNYTLPFIQKLLYDTNAAGIILLSPLSDPALLDELDHIVPVVQCTEFNEFSAKSCVSIDDLAASKSVVEYILSKGKRKIALLNGPLNFKYARKRLEGYLQAHKEAGVEVNEDLITTLPEINYEIAQTVVTHLLNNAACCPDAIFAVSDTIAAAALKSVRRAGLRVPEDVGIVGFDNTYISKLTEPALTTVNQPQSHMGGLAAELLIERIKNPAAVPRQLMLQTELIIRDSL